MRLIATLVLTALVASALPSQAAAETKIDVSGQIRFRSEFDDRSFDCDAEMSTYHLLRTRLGVGATVDENARFFVQLQDSRTLGAMNQFEELQSGTTQDSKNVDVHQAYLKIRRLWFDGLGLKAGRFEVALGNQRVFGPVGWSNVGRSWEGLMAWYEAEEFRAKAMALKGRELDAPFRQPEESGDLDVYAFVLDLKDPALQVFLSYDRDAGDSMVSDSTSSGIGPLAGSSLAESGDDANNMDRITLGAFFENEVEEMHIDYSLNVAYQTGTVHGVGGVPGPEYDISAYMVNFELGYTIEGERPARIAGAIDYTSGDEDASDTDWGAYHNLYYTGHKWRGYMDYFTGSNAPGLMDLVGRAKIELSRDWWLFGDVHYFRTAQDYRDPLDTNPDDGIDTTNDVGVEVDLTLETKSVQGVRMTGGASLFVPKESFAGFEDPDPGLWFYYQFQVDFD